MKKVLPLVLLLGILLTACGAKTPPTMDPNAVQASAVAMAFTMSAQTMAAQPTATPIPPTETPTVPPPASPTPFALPTFPAIQPTATKSVSGDACLTSLVDMKAGGPKTALLIDNRTKDAVVFSLYLNENDFACGWVPGVSNIPKNANIGPLMLPNGCYYPSAYVGSKASLSGPSFCIHGGDKVTVIIEYGGIKIAYP
jgi:hypothetical protein